MALDRMGRFISVARLWIRTLVGWTNYDFAISDTTCGLLAFAPIPALLPTVGPDARG
ncbi:MAG: hypothetical protein OXN89_22215 [Bryobacterales bacterium]|nr:hypothetical protein [Bryobacterales bacterium]